MKRFHLWPSDTFISDGFVKAGYILEKSDSERISIFYRIPEEYKDSLTASCDPFVLETLFSAMRGSADLIVHGQVSPSLMANLEEFQLVWANWRPSRYQKIEIQADLETDQAHDHPGRAVMAFSGGVDSCFTAWRHRMGKAGRQLCNLDAGVFIHGFDIPLNQTETFHRAAGNIRVILNSVGMEMIPIVHNSKYLGEDLDDFHAAVLVSCLMILQNRFSIGLLASSVAYIHLLKAYQLPFGSTPLTDWMLSSSRFSVIEDGAAHNRIGKIAEISKWPEAMQHLRVCLSKVGMERDRNCCRCEKCARNILTFRVLELDRPPCFEHDLSNLQILGLHYPSNVRVFYIELLLKAAEQRNLKGLWLIVLRINLFINLLNILIRKTALWQLLQRSRRRIFESRARKASAD